MTPQFRLYAIVTTLAFALVTIPAFAMDASQAFVASGCDAPSYDQRTLTDEVQGQVRLNFLLDEKGDVVDAKITGTSGFRVIDKESMRALKACRFNVGVNMGITAGWNNLAFVWKLK
ncbi:energy transducer TonB [Undibacterium pigrum]|uniref:TonB family protein n=1 Tax=Undibacterium pigrum TaxID=401470 RepID=A0A318IRK8_9BURK|nr:TonB family protein [Undibacterium pigrum]PXX35304.1 TonB family protein [Undibacterium pigrum]